MPPEIKAREVIEAARIAQEKAVLAARIAAEQETKTLSIAQDEAIDDRRDQKARCGRGQPHRGRACDRQGADRGVRRAARCSRSIRKRRSRSPRSSASSRLAGRSSGSRPTVPVRAAEINARQEVDKIEITLDASWRSRGLSGARRWSRSIWRAPGPAGGRDRLARGNRARAHRLRTRARRGTCRPRTRAAQAGGLPRARRGKALMEKAIALYEKSLEESAAKVEAGGPAGARGRGRGARHYRARQRGRQAPHLRRGDAGAEGCRGETHRRRG